MKQEFFDLIVETQGKSLVDLRAMIESAITEKTLQTVLLTLWCAHTGASLIVQATQDPTVESDLIAFFEEQVPKDPGKYQHAEGQDDNAPSHLRAALTQTQISLPIQDGILPLGNTQVISLFEHREKPTRRTLKAHYIGI